MTCRYTIFISVFALLSFALSGLFAQPPADGENEYRLAGVNRQSSGADTMTSDAGRGVWVAHDPDLDNDGKPEILVTEYTKGGRVFVYEVVGNDLLEFVWASKHLHETRGGGGSTPRSITTGDFDNNGKQEIIFPIGFSASDSLEFANRGIYFYEWTGTDNDYGTEPTFKLTYEYIDSGFTFVEVGRIENGLRVQDIDGDGKSELLFPPRAFNFGVAKLYIMQVNSGTFAGGDAVIDTEYVYKDMVLVPSLGTDGYVPIGTEIGDVDGDELDEIIVAGWTNIGPGSGLGFITINGPDSYTPGSIVHLSDISMLQVKAKPQFTLVNDEPVVYIHGGSSELGAPSQMWIVEGIISAQFVNEANITELFSGVGVWGTWDLGDQDHPTLGSGDGIDLYLGQGSRFLDIEYKGTGLVTDTSSYTITQILDLRDSYTSLDGLINDVYTYPGMDLDADGKRDIVFSYKGSPSDSLGGRSLAKNGFHVYFMEWGDSLTSINLDSALTGFEVKKLTVIMPDDYRLEQNYPNPFNPTTTINFTLPINKAISVKIYNSLGQEVRTLIKNKPYAAGTHSVQWDATDNKGNPVASGVYIYKLIYGNFSKSKRMTLVR